MIGCPACEQLTGRDCGAHGSQVYGHGLTPHRCPICYGRGIVPVGFYSTTEMLWSAGSTGPETCRACKGTGVLWQ